ncbi:MAG: hypothetical protein EOO43_04840 [Flavobacterium sp.]|nr:MAG: hypothetical protein EOO43_04840 [Flavobacterium sp.]
MLEQITSLNDVEVFAKQFISEGVSFHPDDDFNDYVYYKKNKPCYTRKEAEKRNQLMQQCFAICEKNGVDIYLLMFNVTLKETGMDRYIPLQSDTPQ